MSKIINPHENDQGLIKSAPNPIHRRSFIKYAGAGVALSAMFIAGCNDNDDDEIDYSKTNIMLGTGDTAILNFAYALEQLEAAFYTQVIENKFSGITALETSVLTDIRDHEIAHREFFKTVLGSNAIQMLTPDFSSINFGDRTSVLQTAQTFEDLGVSAYNGAGKHLTNATNLALAGKIVSVEARHAAEIREIIQVNTFASRPNPINTMGLDLATPPAQVLTAAQKFIKERINTTNVPTT